MENTELIADMEADLDIFFSHQRLLALSNAKYNKTVDILCQVIKERTSRPAHLPFDDELSQISSAKKERKDNQES